MPSVINGIGTWYWGKRNMRTRRAVCSFCGHAGDLKSYDTTLFFVVFFVPLVPLSRKRIIDECAKCRKHLAAPLKKWEKGKNEAIAGALAICEDPSGPPTFEKAVNALGACVAYQDDESFQAVATILLEPASLTGNPEFQRVLAEGYAHFGHYGEAEAALRASLDLKPDPEVSERLGVHLLRHGSVDEGWPLVAHALENKDREQAGLVYLAVEAYQAAGRHKEALDLLDRLAAAFPELARDKWHKRYANLSRRHGGTRGDGTGKKIPSPLVGADVQRTSDRPWRARAAWIVGPAVVALLIACYLLSAAATGRARKVWVVNGLDRPYVAEIAGKPVTLPGLTARDIRVPEGVVTIKVTTADLNIADSSVRISTPFFSRPFVKRTFIINPDQVALVGEETATYTHVHGGAPPQGASKLHVGRPLYELRGLDYEFKEFPAQLKTSASTRKLTKRRVTQWFFSPVEATAVVTIEAGQGVAAERARRWVTLRPEEAEGYGALVATHTPAEALATIKPLLLRRPVLMEAHRMYQEVSERERPEQDLAAEYRALLAREPQSAALGYLLGRVTPDRAEAITLWSKAAESRPAEGAPASGTATGSAPAGDNAARAYAYGAIGFDLTTQGRFEEGLASFRKAIALDSTNQTLLANQEDALHALGKFDEVLQGARFRHDLREIAPNTIFDKIYFVFRQSGEHDTIVMVDGFANEIAQDDEPSAGLFRNFALAVVDYCKGNEAAYAEKLKDGLEADIPALDVAISAGDLAKAAKSAQNEPVYSGMNAHLLVYLAAMSRAGDAPPDGADKELAEKELALGVESLKRGGREERHAAAWLTAPSAPKAADVLGMPIPMENKRVLLAAMGLKHPEVRNACFELARNLNYDLRFPHLLIERVVGGK